MAAGPRTRAQVGMAARKAVTAQQYGIHTQRAAVVVAAAAKQSKSLCYGTTVEASLRLRRGLSGDLVQRIGWGCIAIVNHPKLANQAATPALLRHTKNVRAVMAHPAAHHPPGFNMPSFFFLFYAFSAVRDSPPGTLGGPVTCFHLPLMATNRPCIANSPRP